MPYCDPRNGRIVNDATTRPDRYASPHISLHVLYGLCAEARKAGVKHISVDELEQAIDNYRKVTRQ